MLLRICSSLASPDSETAVNTLVLVAHGIQSHLARLDEMKISASIYTSRHPLVFTLGAPTF